MYRAITQSTSKEEGNFKEHGNDKFLVNNGLIKLLINFVF